MYIKSTTIENSTTHINKIFSALCQKLGANNGISAIDNSTKTIGAVNNNISDILNM